MRHDTNPIGQAEVRKLRGSAEEEMSDHWATGLHHAVDQSKGSVTLSMALS